MEKIKAIILAGGFGTRTQGVLKNLPKTLVVTSDGKTILQHTIDDLVVNCELEDVFIVSNSLHYQAIKSHVDKLEHKKIRVIDNGKKIPEKRLGALGDLMFVFNNINDSKVSYLVVPCDTTYWQSFSLKDFMTFSLADKESFVTIFRDVKDPNIIKGRFGCALLDDKNNVINFTEKPNQPQSTFAASPFYIYRQKHISLLKEYLEKGYSPDHPGSFIPFLIEKKMNIKAFIVKNLIIDAGTPIDIEKAKKY